MVPRTSVRARRNIKQPQLASTRLFDTIHLRRTIASKRPAARLWLSAIVRRGRHVVVLGEAPIDYMTRIDDRLMADPILSIELYLEPDGGPWQKERQQPAL